MHFVHDGCERACDGLIAQFAPRWKRSIPRGLGQRDGFSAGESYREIRREVSRRLVANKRFDEITSPYNLYFSS